MRMRSASRRSPRCMASSARSSALALPDATPSAGARTWSRPMVMVAAWRMASPERRRSLVRDDMLLHHFPGEYNEAASEIQVDERLSVGSLTHCHLALGGALLEPDVQLDADLGRHGRYPDDIGSEEPRVEGPAVVAVVEL